MERDTVEQKTVCEAQYVVFKLGTEKFGVVINKVKENSDYISGIAKMTDDLVMLLNINEVVSQVTEKAM